MNRNVIMRLSALFFLAVTFVQAAPVERDLGQGLAYYRVHRLPDDLPTTEAARHKPCVLDVRYVHGDSKAAAALAGWLKFHAARTTPVFVLANGETSRAILIALADHEPGAGVMTVGGATREFQPDIAVNTTPDNERRAYDALDQGTPLATLLTDNPDKARNDEASLSKDRPVESALEEGPEAERKHAAPAPVDAALQRAVHLHRALVALRKI
jgi:hypothetical protein